MNEGRSLCRPGEGVVLHKLAALGHLLTHGHKNVQVIGGDKLATRCQKCNGDGTADQKQSMGTSAWLRSDQLIPIPVGCRRAREDRRHRLFRPGQRRATSAD